MFDEAKCDLCGDCLAKCPYINFNAEASVREFRKLLNREKVDWLKKCVTCFACNEYCSKGARPFDLIVSSMEAMGNYVDAEVVSFFQTLFTPKTYFEAPKAEGTVLSVCTIEPNLPFGLKGPMFEGLTVVKGRHYFCNVVYLHLGNETIMRKGIQLLVNNYASLEAEEIVFMHDDCYALMASFAPRYGIELPFRPVHIFEYLLNYLKVHTDDIGMLNKKVAYQRPCASRFTSWKEPMLDELLRLIGVERVVRKYDRENALCCGQDLKGAIKRGSNNFPRYRDLNIGDAKDHRAEAMVFLCPMCLDALQEKCQKNGLQTYMIYDLCRLALGETLR
jgi:Fe-S oxidoreductase